MTNRHGLVAGATGTGKTVTLQVMAEALSAIGVPVFAADVKGDLSGISQPGKSSPKFDGRVQAMGMGAMEFSELPGCVLGCVRQGRAPGAGDGERDGAAAAGTHSEPE